jgi:hypothetical protein
MIRMPRTAAALVARSLVASAVALGLAVGTTSPASAAPSAKADKATKADKAAAWLAGQTDSGVVSITADGVAYPEYGLTIDVVTALREIGGQKKAVKQVQKALAKNAGSYTTGVDFGSSDVYAGATAKLLTYVQAVGADGTDFGGLNLVKQLTGRVSKAKGTKGRVQDKSDYGDYANVIGQSYAAAALNEAGSKWAKASTRFLLQQQCAPGYFRLDFAKADADDQTCDGAPKKARKADTDATALAVLNLQSIEKPSTAVRSALDAAVAWLLMQQKKDGSFGGGTSTKGANSNSTGLAAWALARADECDAAQDAATWVKGLQRGNGAVAYDAAAAKDGLSKATVDQWKRATAQAAPALQLLAGC